MCLVRLLCVLARWTAYDAAAPPLADLDLGEFEALQHSQAVAYYEELYGDGVGISTERPPRREVFLQNYVNEALREEAQRRLGGGRPPQESPQAAASRQAARVPGQAPRAGALAEQIEELRVQKRQKVAVLARARPGKAQEVLAPASEVASRSWELPCAPPLHRSAVYGPVPQCSPGPTGPPCRRLLLDGFSPPEEREALLQLFERQEPGLQRLGAETLLVLDRSARGPLGSQGASLVQGLLERTGAQVARSLNLSRVFISGALLKRLDHPPLHDGQQADRAHESFNAHVDKANIASYDYSTLLYLNTAGEDFGGGELAFNDEGTDRIVRPLAGRLVAFSSGLENLHQVLPLRWGRRYVLSAWFTCSEAHAGGGPAGPPRARRRRRRRGRRQQSTRSDL